MSNKCLNCGAETKDKDIFSRVCPYCGSVFIKSPFGILDFINEEQAKKAVKEQQEKYIEMQKEIEQRKLEVEREETRRRMTERIRKEKKRKTVLASIFVSLIPISWITCYILYRVNLIGENAGIMGGFLFSLFFIAIVIKIETS